MNAQSVLRGRVGCFNALRKTSQRPSYQWMQRIRSPRTSEVVSTLKLALGRTLKRRRWRLVFGQVRRTQPHIYIDLTMSVPYPNNPRQRCDVKLVTREGPLFIEGKLLRLKGDNGKPNDNMLMHILSPYPQHRSALTDCVKLGNLGIADDKAIVLIGYTYDDMPLDPAICAFETLASDRIGPRSEAVFSGLCHSVHCAGRVMAWPVH
jgi:hypothetical protein